MSMKQIEEERAQFIADSIKEANRNQTKAEYNRKVKASKGEKGEGILDLSLYYSIINIILILIFICQLAWYCRKRHQYKKMKGKKIEK